MSGVINNRRFTVVVWGLVCIGAIVMGVILAASGAPKVVVLAALLAAVPVGPIVACYLWLDRYEPEPRKLLAAALLWGAFGATTLSVLVQITAEVQFGLPDRRLVSVVAPVSEEAAKGMFLLLLLWWRRHELDGVLDGIVYAGLVGLGFAYVENILYLSAAYTGGPEFGLGGPEALTSIFILRCLLSPFAHSFFTAFVGVGVGIAVSTASSSRRLIAPIVGYLVAVSAHALWNSSTLLGSQHFISVYLTMMAPAFLLLIAFAIWWRRSEAKMLHLALHDAAQRGFLPLEHIPWMVDLRHRRAARDYAMRYGGHSGKTAMREYQQAAVELGFLHYRYLRGTAPTDFAARGQEYVNRMHALRSVIAFPESPQDD